MRPTTSKAQHLGTGTGCLSCVRAASTIPLWREYINLFYSNLLFFTGVIALCLTAVDQANYISFFHLKYKFSNVFSFDDSNILQIVVLKKYVATDAISIVLIVFFVFGSTYGTFWCLKWSQCLASLFKVLTYVRKCALWPETSFMYLPIASVF